jgi:hypothetical protein
MIQKWRESHGGMKLMGKPKNSREERVENIMFQFSQRL